MVEHEVGRRLAIGDGADGVVEADAQRHDVVEQRLARLGAHPPDALVALAVRPRVLLRQHRLADAAEAAHRRRAGLAVAACVRTWIGQRGAARRAPQLAVDGGELVLARGEAGHRPHLGVDDLLARARMKRREARLRPVVLRIDRAEHRLADGGGIVEQRHEIDVGNGLQEPDRRALLDAQHDEPLPRVAGVVGQRVAGLDDAVRLRLVGFRQHRDDAGAGLHHAEALVHALGEGSIAEILVLDEGRVAFRAQDGVDGQRRVLVLARAGDEEIAPCNIRVRHETKARPVNHPGSA